MNDILIIIPPMTEAVRCFETFMWCFLFCKISEGMRSFKWSGMPGNDK